MIAGRQYWIMIWYGILALGVLGLWSALFWARRTRWQNVDELLRAAGTILVSSGMLMLLNSVGGIWGQGLLALSLACFLTALLVGRRMVRRKSNSNKVT